MPGIGMPACTALQDSGINQGVLWLQQEQLIKAESVILSCLGFRVMTPHSFGFMSLLQQLLEFPRKVGYLASFILV